MGYERSWGIIAECVVRVVGQDGIEEGVGDGLREPFPFRLQLSSKLLPDHQDVSIYLPVSGGRHDGSNGGDVLHEAAGDEEFSGLDTRSGNSCAIRP